MQLVLCRLDQETAQRLEAQDVQQSLRNKIEFQDQLHSQVGGDSMSNSQFTQRHVCDSNPSGESR